LEIVFSGIGEDAGVIGAVNRAMDCIFTVEASNIAGEQVAKVERRPHPV
jgi:hypothetical protein